MRRSVLLAFLIGGAGCSLLVDTGGFDDTSSIEHDDGGGASDAKADGGTSADSGVTPNDDASIDAGHDALLVGDWPLDEGAGTTIGDQSGHGHGGIIFGGTWIADPKGTAGSALAFDGGASSYVSIGGAPDFDRVAMPAFTMCAWARFDETPSHDMFFSVSFGGQDSAYGIEVISASELTYWDGKNHVAVATIPSPMGQWHHYAVVVDGNKARIFFDGVRLTEGVADTTPRSATQVFFGRSSFGDSLNGAVDKARFFRSALTDGEVLAEKNR